ncbi:hypothetical protein Bca52824_019274 [Brassica carinata]|uniref:Uncharacterized protein n=1 Tax=Brassica carinata TaxID=52824 RepID=A0A8X8B088_BRACI|nr:hypothetical protein Bca52824_019274 [Brassica carinata]
MDRRSWLWRKSFENSHGETESTGSLSSHSERFSDDQNVIETTRRLAVLLCQRRRRDNDDVQILMERLSAALLNVSLKDDLAKVEKEAAVLKQQLSASVSKELSFEATTALKSRRSRSPPESAPSVDIGVMDDFLRDGEASCSTAF